MLSTRCQSVLQNNASNGLQHHHQSSPASIMHSNPSNVDSTSSRHLTTLNNRSNNFTKNVSSSSSPSSSSTSSNNNTVLSNFVASATGKSYSSRYNRRNNPELEKRRIHHCDFLGEFCRLYFSYIYIQKKICFC